MNEKKDYHLHNHGDDNALMWKQILRKKKTHSRVRARTHKQGRLFIKVDEVALWRLIFKRNFVTGSKFVLFCFFFKKEVNTVK